LGKPFDGIFGSLAEARFAFDLLRWTLIKLGATPEGYDEDARIALTLPISQSPSKIRLNFGNWAILTFLGPERGELRLEFLCRKDNVPASAKASEYQFADEVEGKALVLASVEPSRMQVLSTKVQR
jgi:hypothetical protein